MKEKEALEPEKEKPGQKNQGGSEEEKTIELNKRAAKLNEKLKIMKEKKMHSIMKLTHQKPQLKKL